MKIGRFYIVLIEFNFNKLLLIFSKSNIKKEN